MTHYPAMLSSFKTYPAHPWLAHWPLEPRLCASTYRESNAAYLFRTGETLGRIAPNLDAPAWTLQVRVPQNSRTVLLFNGFCAYFDSKRRACAAEVSVPEPGVVWGRCDGIPDPVLLAAPPPENRDGMHWLEDDAVPALLAVRDGAFCLVTRLRLFDEAAALAEAYLESDIGEHLREEAALRAGAATLFDGTGHHDALLAIAIEGMMRALRPPEGHIPMVWSEAAGTAPPCANANELFVLASAWRLVDPAVAESLVLCILRLQENSGAIPVLNPPRGTRSVLEAPKPLLARTVETVWQVREDPAFLDPAFPLLRRHLQWLLHHFDPKRRQMHCWRSRDEMLEPGLFESDLATADLTALLLAEIEALNRLRRRTTRYANGPDLFPEEREALAHNLLHVYWNDADAAFSNAFVRDTATKLQGLPALVPLLWDKLPGLHRSAILDHAKAAGTLPGGLDVLSWRNPVLDDPAFPLMRHWLTLQLLEAGEPHGTLLADFAQITLRGFVEWHAHALEKGAPLRIAPAVAAFIAAVAEKRRRPRAAPGAPDGFAARLVRKARIDRTDLVIIAATLVAVAGIRGLYGVLKAPPPYPALFAQMNAAYANKEGDEALRNSLAIIKHYPADAALARLLAGNVCMAIGDHAAAAGFFAEVRREYPDSPGAMIGLGLALQLQGRFAEAEGHYAEFCYLFDGLFPELVREVGQWRLLAQEGFRAPPKWLDMYGYQIMHEL